MPCLALGWHPMTGRFAISVPGSRGPNDPWFRIGTLDVTTTVFVILTCVVSMLVWALEGPDHDILGKLTLIARTRARGSDLAGRHLARSQPPDIWLVIMLAVFWYFGTEVERLLGRVRFAVFIGLVTVIPGNRRLPSSTCRNGGSVPSSSASSCCSSPSTRS